MAAGTIPLSMTQQFDEYGEPLSGGQLYIIQAGTVSTPQNAYQDTGMTVLMPYPIPLDAAGRIPQFFLDNAVNATVKIRLQDSAGVVQLAADNVLIIGPAGGGGVGGATIDSTTIYQTGDIKPRYGIGAHAGWVRANNRTIGSGTSGASERADPDCQALFQHLWGADTTLAVSGGRGASAAADWTANKQIALPDFRGYALGALGDMGNTATTVLTSTYFGTSPTVLGAAGGGQSRALVTANLPAYTPTGTVTGTVPTSPIIGGTTVTGPGGTDVNRPAGTSNITADFAGDPQGGLSTQFSLVSPLKLVTFYIKL